MESRARMIKILMVLGNTGRGGAQAYAMNVLRSIDRSRFHIDFVVNYIYENGYADEIRENGSTIHVIPKFKGTNYFAYVRAFNKVLDEGNYDIVHGHVSSSASIYLRIAKEHHCITIAHSHSAGYRGNGIEQQIKRVFTFGAKKQADYWFGCSRLAAERMFGRNYKSNPKYHDIPNAIIVDRYRYNEEIRARIREQYGISNDAIVYGHVGSFSAPKNHRFLIEVFKKIYSDQREKACFILVGDGLLKDNIRKMVMQNGLSDRVIFTGNVDNVNEFLMAMDVLVFPSLFDGFPVTLLEAQAAGLPCISSNTITSEVNITENVMPTSLSAGADYWAKKAEVIEKRERTVANDIIADSVYNVNKSISLLMELYKKMVTNHSN